MSQVPPPPPPPSTPEPSPNQHREPFPSASTALAAGWEFCKANFWLVALLAGLATVVSLIANLPSYVSDSPNQVLLILLSLVSAFVSVVLVLGLLRRAFDYWDETHGRAEPRDFSAALSTAIEGAMPRLFPWIGWNLVFGIIIAIVVIPFIVVMAAAGSAGVTVLLSLLLLVLFFVASVYLAFVPAAIADRPGNPFATSMEVVRGNFWTVLGTFLLLVVFVIVAYIPLIIILAILGSTTLGAIVGLLYVLVLVTVVEAVGLGAIVTMYRSVIQP